LLPASPRHSTGRSPRPRLPAGKLLLREPVCRKAGSPGILCVPSDPGHPPGREEGCPASPGVGVNPFVTRFSFPGGWHVSVLVPRRPRASIDECSSRPVRPSSLAGVAGEPRPAEYTDGDQHQRPRPRLAPGDPRPGGRRRHDRLRGQRARHDHPDQRRAGRVAGRHHPGARRQSPRGQRQPRDPGLPRARRRHRRAVRLDHRQRLRSEFHNRHPQRRGRLERRHADRERLHPPG
jgi:hypothetical protein